MEKTLEIHLAEHGERIAKAIEEESIWGGWNDGGYNSKPRYFVDQERVMKIARNTK